MLEQHIVLWTGLHFGSSPSMCNNEKKAPVFVVPCSFSKKLPPKNLKNNHILQKATFPQTNMAPQNGWLEAKRLSFWDGFELRKEPKEPTGRTNRGGGYDGNPTGTSVPAVEQWWGALAAKKNDKLYIVPKLWNIFLFYKCFFCFSDCFLFDSNMLFCSYCFFLI